MYFESHAHYDDERYDGDRDKLLSSLKDYGVDIVINAGATMDSSKKSIELSKKYPFIYAGVGVHPHDVKDMTEADIETLYNYCQNEKVVAVGEIGLDFYYDNSPRELQKYWFKKQLELAEQVDLPVIIHSRDASQLTFDIIKESKVRKGVIHCFSGSPELALEYVKMGFYIGIGGVVTYSNAKNVVKTVEVLNLNNILIETDCPYLSPVPMRGKRNSSQYLNYICDKVGIIKQMPGEKVAEITSINGHRLFSTKKNID